MSLRINIPSQKDSHEHRRRRIQNLLFRFLIFSAALGVTLPLSTIILKDAVRGFPGWISWIQARPSFQWLDFHSKLEFLAGLSWHDPQSAVVSNYYFGYALINGAILFAMLRFRQVVFRNLGVVADWYLETTYKGPRKIILTFVLFMVFTYLTKLTPGFWIPGIAGWTYEQMASQLGPVTEPAAPGSVPAFIRLAIRPSNARYLPRDGTLSGKALFLHFSNGVTLPANNELTNLVFPQYAFRGLNEPGRRKAFFQSIAATLAHREAGTNFILPLAWAYPNHAPYMPVDYDDYPDSNLLTEISQWDVTVLARTSGTVELVSAKKMLSVRREVNP